VGEGLTVRELRAEDVPAVLALLRAALGEGPLLRRTEELFRWKHVENPFGPSVALVAESGGDLVGLRAFMRWDLAHPGGVLRCGRAVDTATHPRFRRRGIFRRLTMEALEVAAAAGIRLVFNTPNDRSRPGYLTMGWRDVGPVRVLVRPRPAGFRRREEEGVPDPAAFLPAGEPVDPALLPPERGAVTGRGGGTACVGLGTPRGERYLRWRFTGHPTAPYRMLRVGGGAVVVRANVRRGRRELVVSDAFGEDVRPVLRRLVRAARVAYTVAAFPHGSRARRAAISAMMVPVPRVAALRLVARPLADLGDLGVDVFDPEVWRLSLGDLELL